MKSWIAVFLLVGSLPSSNVLAQDLLLEDYQSGGVFRVNRFDNSFGDSEGRKNSSKDSGDDATVNWAAKWSGLESTGKPTDLSEYRTFQIDVMVKPGQPMEANTNFYFQLMHHADVGYAYWEIYVPQAKVPADGKWYRIRFPFTKFYSNAGDGADKPTDFAKIIGTVCGMTYDDTGDDHEYKTAHFDNIRVLREEVDGIIVQPVPRESR